MSEPAPRHWSVQEFVAWQERQDERYELVGGVPIRMMAGARDVHDDIVVVLSPSTRDFDAFDTLEGYKTVASLAVILLVEPNAPEIAVWRRDAEEISQRRLVAGLDQAIALPEFGMTLALADVDDGVAFPPRPRLASGT